MIMAAMLSVLISREVSGVLLKNTTAVNSLLEVLPISTVLVTLPQ